MNCFSDYLKVKKHFFQIINFFLNLLVIRWSCCYICFPMFQGLFIVFFIFLAPAVLGITKPKSQNFDKCRSSVANRFKQDDYSKERIKIIRDLRDSVRYSFVDITHKVVRDFPNEKNVEVRRELALDFIEYFQGDNPFVLVDLLSIYLMGKGLSDKNPNIKSMFASAAQYVYEKDLSDLKNVNKMLYNPHSLNYIQKFFRGLSYEDFIGDRPRRESFFKKN